MHRTIPRATVPTPVERANAMAAAKRLDEGLLRTDELPPTVVEKLSRILTLTADGQAVIVEAASASMTTAEAAVYLNVSRPYLVRLLDSGALPYYRVGSHRRIDFEDLRSFRERQRVRSHAIMERLQQEAQEFDHGY